MTNQEAITKLTNIMHDDHYSWHPSILEAFRMAVDALKGAGEDCTSRAEAIDALCKAGCGSEYCGISCDDVKAIEGLPFVQPEQRWITSGKPMNSGMYLVTLWQKFEGEEAYGVRIMRFINGNWMLPKHFPEWINEEIEQEVLAWRELPEPYREEGD